MAPKLFSTKGVPLEQQRFTWRDMVQKPISKLDDDASGWEELITLAKEMGQDDMAQQFEQALEKEREHLQHVRRWHEEATLAEARVLASA